MRQYCLLQDKIVGTACNRDISKSEKVSLQEPTSPVLSSKPHLSMGRIEDSASQLIKSMDLSEQIADKSFSEKPVELEKPFELETQIDCLLLD